MEELRVTIELGAVWIIIKSQGSLDGEGGNFALIERVLPNDVISRSKSTDPVPRERSLEFKIEPAAPSFESWVITIPGIPEVGPLPVSIVTWRITDSFNVTDPPSTFFRLPEY